MQQAQRFLEIFLRILERVFEIQEYVHRALRLFLHFFYREGLAPPTSREEKWVEPLLLSRPQGNVKLVAFGRGYLDRMPALDRVSTFSNGRCNEAHFARNIFFSSSFQSFCSFSHFGTGVIFISILFHEILRFIR